MLLGGGKPVEDGLTKEAPRAGDLAARQLAASREVEDRLSVDGEQLGDLVDIEDLRWRRRVERVLPDRRRRVVGFDDHTARAAGGLRE